MRTLQFFLLLAILACFVSGPVLLSARDGAEGTKAEASATDPPTLWVIRHFQVEPTKVVQFEEALGEIAKGFEQANLGPEYTWLTSSGYLSVGDYRVMYALRSFADLDRQDAWRKPVETVLGKAKLAELERQEASAIRTVKTVVSRHVEELSYRPKESALAGRPAGFVHVGVDYVRPSQLEQYMAVIKRFRNALASINVPFSYDVYEVLLGSEQVFMFAWPTETADQYYRSISLPRFLMEALGREATVKLGNEWRECLWKFEMYDLRPLPELSYIPEGGAAN